MPVKQLLLLHTCLIRYAIQKQIQSLLIIWLGAMRSCSYFTIDGQKSEMEGVRDASAALGLSDSTWTVIWAVILYICTLDFITKWRLLSWNSFGSRQIHHRLSQTQTAAWKWGAKQTHFILCESTQALLLFSLRKWGAAAGRSQPEGMEIWLRNGSYIEAHNHWYSLQCILTTYISLASVMVSNRACVMPLERYFVNKTSFVFFNVKTTCSLFDLFFFIIMFKMVVDSSIGSCLPIVLLQSPHFNQ